RMKARKSASMPCGTESGLTPGVMRSLAKPRSRQIHGLFFR
ncbi:uncharacterized, partial [Tachysurus ichikawai]